MIEIARDNGYSFVSFYEASRDRVYRAALLVSRDQLRAEDATSDAFAAAYARWDRISKHPAPVAWVTRTAINRLRSDWRARWREIRGVEDVDLPEITAPAAESVDPWLVGLVWRLPRRQREVVALRILADLDTNRTAQALGINPKTVTVHLHRALQSLRRELERTDYEELA